MPKTISRKKTYSATNTVAPVSFGPNEEKVPENSLDLAKRLLVSLGLDLSDKNYANTPERFMTFLAEFTKGLREESVTELNQILDIHFPKHNDLKSYYKGMIIQTPVRVYSLCSHHLLPIIYDVSIAYIPTKNKQLGFSKIARALRLMAQRPMNQEDYTQYVVEKLREKLQPEGLAVVVRGIHMCMSMRGAKIDTNNITSAVRGSFKDNISTKEEFMRVALHHDRNRI